MNEHLSDTDSDSDSEDLDSLVNNHTASLLIDHGFPGQSCSHGQRTYSCSSTPSHATLNKDVSRLLDSSLAPSTKTSYTNALQHYRSFHATYGSLPVTELIYQ